MTAHEPEPFALPAALPEGQPTDPYSLRIGEPGTVTVHAAEPVRGAWRQELAVLGGRSPLLHFEDTPTTRIELSTTHPGGLAQFITGNRTLLSNLIRDDLALRAAKGAAHDLTAKAIELATARGIDAIHLAIGMAEWRHDGRDYRAPVLLRPLSIRRYGRDFELKLKGDTIFNPALVRAFEEQFQIALDGDSFVRLATRQDEFTPQAVIDRLRGLTTHLSWFSVQPRLIVSSFAEVSGALVEDVAGSLEHPILDAVAGLPAARVALAEGCVMIDPIDTDRRPVAADTLILDADEEQEQVIAEVAAGNSLVVHTVPGSGATQTIANAAAALVAQHKRVLIVGPRRAGLHSVAERFKSVGLEGLAVSPSTLRADLVRALLRNERATRPSGAEADAALQRLRSVLLDYRHALGHKDRMIGVSVLDALNELSKLALLPEPPLTTARLSENSVIALAEEREHAAQILRDAAALGEFRYGPNDSAWYGAEFATPEDAAQAQMLAHRLHEDLVPRLLAAAVELTTQTSMRPPQTVAETGEQFELLLALRDTLDKFTPDVFDRSLTELILATSPRKQAGKEMSGGDRRRLRKLAQEYVRPGARVDDLHHALQQIQQQRSLWQRYTKPGLTPQVPTGLDELHRLYRETVDALLVIESAINANGMNLPLLDQPYQQLQATLAGLAVQTEAMDNIKERTELLAQLRQLELGPLLRDLADRHVPDDRVALELELAWWQSALSLMLAGNRALLNANTEVVDRLEADFRLVDEAHVATNAALLAWQLGQSWAIGVSDHADEASTLKALLKSGRVTPEALQMYAPTLGRILSPVWTASPYEVPTLPDSMHFDAVILVDAAAVTFAECIPAIRRARQVIAFGDPVSEAPSRFRIALSERPFDGTAPELHAESALLRLGEVLPTKELMRSYRGAGQDLTDLVSRHFYEGSIDSLPWAGQYLGHSSISFILVEGGGAMPDPVSGTVESVDAEVDRVVQLTLDHAQRHPSQTLMIITASPKHAVRLEQAVLAGFASRPDLSEWLLAERGEPFMVATIDQAVGQSRDRVIFSIGYGRTPHGRLLSNFGILGDEGGDRALAHALTRARKALTIVSCFAPEEIDEHRMRNGVLSLAQVLKEAQRREDREDTLLDDSDPLLADLARRLIGYGLRVNLNYRDRLGLVASFGGRAAVIETDQVLLGESLRESLRLRPQQLHRLGWHYLRVHAFELFRDPAQVALRIARTLGAAPAEPQPSLAQTQPVDMRQHLAG